MSKYLRLGIFLYLLLSINVAAACGICTIPRLGKDSHQGPQKWQIGYLFHQKRWHEKEAAEGHALHHDGHHIHNKTREDFHNINLMYKFNDRFELSLDVPYILRRYIEVDTHDIVGAHQQTDGLGDIQLVGQYWLYQQQQQRVGILAGIKFPTGDTKEKNILNQRVEPELQIGSGSYDYVVGVLYQLKKDGWLVKANGSYVISNPGDQEFENGDLLTLSALTGYVLHANSKNPLTIGMDSIVQYQAKQKQYGSHVADSGGVTILMGPSLEVGVNSTTSVFTNIHLPVYQNLGGIHQELDMTWEIGTKMMF